MSQRHTVPKRNTTEIYDHNKIVERTFRLFQRDLSQEHSSLAKKYDIAMVKDTLFRQKEKAYSTKPNHD